MTLTVDKASWMRQSDGFYVAFRVREPQVGEELCRRMEDGKVRELTVKRRRRSLDANAYAWMLMGKLAAKLRLTPEEVYRQYIPDIGGNYEAVSVADEAVETFAASWADGHLGRMVRRLGASGPGRTDILCYYGSSDYDTAQMSRLIELIVQDCKTQGIETLTGRELSLLTEKWRAK